MGTEEIGKGSFETPVLSNQPMPPYPEGPAVDSLTPQQAAEEWEAMTIDKDGKYANWPISVSAKRRMELYKKGIAPQVEKEKQRQKEQGENWLEKENEKIAERDGREAERKAEEINIKFFGSEKEFDRVFEEAVKTANQFSEENKDFLYTEIPNSKTGFVWADSPFIISLLAGINEDSDLIKSVNKIGLEKLVSLANKSGILGRRK